MRRIADMALLCSLYAILILPSIARAQWNTVPAIPAGEISDLWVDNDTLWVTHVSRAYYHPLNSTLWQPLDSVPTDAGLSSIIKVNDRIYVGTFGDGVFESSDGGQTWTRRALGLVGGGALSIPALASRGDSIYAGTAGSSIFVMPVGGTTWAPFREGILSLVAWDVYALFNYDGWLFTGSGQNAYVYRNAPDSTQWTAIEFVPFNPNGVAMLAFARSGDTLFGAGTNGLYTSLDTGATWTRDFVSPNLASQGAISISGQRLFAMLAYSNRYAVYEFDGTIWQPVSEEFGALAYDMAVLENRYYVARYDGLWYLPLDPTDAPEEDPILPLTLQLGQNFPNPFNPSTSIAYSLPAATRVQLTIFNLRGERVTALLDGHQSAGEHRIEWDGTNSRGERVSSGVYLYRLETNVGSLSRKMLLVK